MRLAPIYKSKREREVELYRLLFSQPRTLPYHLLVGRELASLFNTSTALTRAASLTHVAAAHRREKTEEKSPTKFPLFFTHTRISVYSQITELIGVGT